jgi:hypothetical protein
VVEGDEVHRLLLVGLVGRGVFADQRHEFVQSLLLDLPQFGGDSFGEGDGLWRSVVLEDAGVVGWVGKAVPSAYSGISNLVLLPMGLSSKVARLAGMGSF